MTSDDFVRVELFTWAMESPSAGEPFLRDTASSGGPYQRALERMATGDSEGALLARLLATDPAVRRRRFAWTTPMGTAIPLGTRSYGPALIRLVLEEGSFFLHFTPEQTPSFRAFNGAGREVALSAVLADPARIASVFHEQASVPMREFVVHGRVARVQTNTEAIRERLRRETEMLASMRVWSRTHGEGTQSMATHLAREEVIRRIREEGGEPRCLMCAIAARGVGDLHVAFEDAEVLAFLPRYVRRWGEVCVMPKRHVTSFTELDMATWLHTQALV